MSIVLFIKAPSMEVQQIEVGGTESLKELYKKVSVATGITQQFTLLHEGKALGASESAVNDTNLEEGSEVNLERVVCRVRVEDLKEERKEIQQRVAEQKGLVLEIVVSGSMLEMDGGDIPEGVEHVVITDPDNTVVAIKSSFLSYSNIKTLQLCLGSVKHIESYFLSSSTITSIDVASMTGVTVVDGYFLFQCEELTSFTTPFSLRSIPSYFMFQCSALVCVDFSSLTDVATIGNCFLSNCKALKKIDITPLRKLQKVDSFFLANCYALHKLDFSPLNGTVVSDEGFLDATRVPIEERNLMLLGPNV
eukprot:TRINITY_DN19517_c0_g1_i1.p1 TRINITY_DN19517_c0_g1~~TRINITY_DN19517_c0_g1_i1.p1  ORF type:complete len:307 (+),score=60.99 TRINITY_DN19517_c0_g1_i1:45-965(+)